MSIVMLIQHYKNSVRIFNLYNTSEEASFQIEEFPYIHSNDIKEIEHDIKFFLTELYDGMPAGVCRICYKSQNLIIKPTVSYIYCEYCRLSTSQFVIN